MRRIFAIALASVLSVTAAGAHNQSTIDATIPPNEAGIEGGLYEWEAVGHTTIWRESNGKTDNGMFAWPDGRSHAYSTAYNDSKPDTIPESSARPDGRNILGLQLHNVCYGTFPAACDPAKGCRLNCSNRVPGPDCLNCHHSGVYLFTYLPWGYFANGKWVDGTKQDCEAWGGEFVERDEFVTGGLVPYDTQDPDVTLVAHLHAPATQCFPQGYGRAPTP
jgi:hypothetical protein